MMPASSFFAPMPLASDIQPGAHPGRVGALGREHGAIGRKLRAPVGAVLHLLGAALHLLRTAGDLAGAAVAFLGIHRGVSLGSGEARASALAGRPPRNNVRPLFAFVSAPEHRAAGARKLRNPPRSIPVLIRKELPRAVAGLGGCHPPAGLASG